MLVPEGEVIKPHPPHILKPFTHECDSHAMLMEKTHPTEFEEFNRDKTKFLCLHC